MANSADPHCLQRQVISRFSRTKVKKFVLFGSDKMYIGELTGHLNEFIC